MLLTPYDLRVTDDEPPAFTGDIVDPRDGLPANQFVLATIGWELMADAADFVNAADAAGCRVNDVALDDALWKFGLNYVLNHTGGDHTSGTYAWMNPTYVRQYTLGPLLNTVPCLQAAGKLTPELAQLAGLLPGVPSPAPILPNHDIRSGILTYTPGHYPPLTDVQCIALAAAEAAHMAHDEALIAHDWTLAASTNTAVLPLQRAFEATAADFDQATLFRFIWAPEYNRDNPQDVLDGLTQRIITHHMAWTAAFHCDTHESPDVTRIIEEELWHNQLHWCRATIHDLDRAIRTVCIDRNIDECPHLSCRKQAAL